MVEKLYIMPAWNSLRWEHSVTKVRPDLSKSERRGGGVKTKNVRLGVGGDQRMEI